MNRDLVNVTRISKRAPDVAPMVKASRTGAFESICTIIGADLTARAGSLVLKGDTLQLPIYHGGGDSIVVEGPVDTMRSLVQFLRLVATHDSRIVMDETWDDAARVARIPMFGLKQPARKLLDAVQHDRYLLASAAYYVVETGEAHDRIKSKGSYSIAQLFEATMKYLAGHGSIDKHLPEPAGTG